MKLNWYICFVKKLNMETATIERAKSWITGAYDIDTKNEVNNLLNGDPKLLEDAFYRNLEFGTGGLRGIMGAGTNRMNKYTVGMATQGLANYILECFKTLEKIKVAISYDSRNNSRFFAKVTAEIFAANGIIVYLFDNLRPTPELSYAIRHLGCQAGVMVTASHNPKEYNGYKVYWEDGAQVIAPHDKNIIDHVNKITDLEQVKFGNDSFDGIIGIGENIDKVYIEDILSLMLSPESVKRHKDLKIVYTALHGTGVRLVPRALKQLGFDQIHTVSLQDISDGNFPTIASPNPEEPSALALAVELAEKKNADLVMATDPDADRIGIAVRDDKGKMVLLNGNQTASILSYYILTRWKELGKLNKDTYTVKTIVTSELLKAISESFGVEIYDVLTGFKYIADIVKKNEGKRTFICGGEESYGFNIGEFVRDKDAVVTASCIAECAAWAADQGLSLYGLLQKIYAEYGIYKEKLLSVVKKGKEGAEAIQAMMDNFRANPPKEIAASKVEKIIDYNQAELTGLPKSNVLRFFLEDGSVISVRPSGTEPKIKFYFGVKGNNADQRLEELFKAFNN